MPIESFKSHFVDYTESMSEVQMQKMTVDQCKEQLLISAQMGEFKMMKKIAKLMNHDQNIIN